MRRSAGLFACVAFAAALHGQTPAGSDSPAASASTPALPAGRIVHLRLTGDLDCDRLARDFAAAVDSAAAASAAALFIELDGNRARPDVVAAMARHLTACRVRTAAYLGDARDRTVGLGQLALALRCRDVFIAPATRIAHTPADELRDLAPDRTDWARLAAAAVTDGAERLGARGADSRLAKSLWNPDASAWFTSSPPPGQIETSPAAGATRFVVFGEPGPGLDRIDIDAALAVALRLARSSPPSPARALAELGARSRAARTRVELTSGLADAERRLLRAIEELQSRRERIEETLRVTTTKLDRRPLPSDYRRAGEAALTGIAHAVAVLDEADGVTADYPELLRDRPATPSAGRARVLAALRSDFQDLRARAEEFRTRR